MMQSQSLVHIPPTHADPNWAPGCCEQGGYCNSLPPPEEKVVDGSVVRLNLLYKTTWCCNTPGLHSKYMQAPPAALRIIGVTPEEWASHVSKLRPEVESHRIGGCCCCLICMGLYALAGLPVYCYCMYNRSTVTKWDEALRVWQSDFNAAVLEPKGAFLKTQSKSDLHQHRDKHGGSSQYRTTARWLAIAFGPDEVQLLKKEPHLEGNVDECCVNEKELCMHP